MMTAASFTMLVATVYAFQGPMVLNVVGNPFAVRAHALPEAREDWVGIPGGTRFVVRLEDRLSTRLSSVGDSFQARLVRPILVDGLEVVPAGAVVLGHVTARDGRGEAGPRLQLRFDAIEVGFDRYALGGSGLPDESGTRVASSESDLRTTAAVACADGGLVAQGPNASFSGGTRVEFRLDRGIRVRVARG